MSKLTDEARSHLQMLTPQKRERKTAKLLAKLADDNDRLTKMLELAARGRIGFRESTWRGATRYRPLVCDSLPHMVDDLYSTPIEALEAAYAEWEKENNSTAHTGRGR